MTISTTTSRASYNGNGVTTVFSVPFRFFQDADLVVELVTTSTGASTTLALTTHYTVTGADDESGGSLTMLTAPTVGQRLVIRRVITATQEVDYISGESFPAETHERALDRLTMLSQQGEEVNARALVFPSGDTASGELPAVATRANKLLGFDSSGGLVVSAPASGSAAELVLDLASTASSNGAEMVAFKQAGAGAIARSVHDELLEEVSVTGFGADPTGTLDSSAAFSAALLAHTHVVVKTPGTYRLDSMVEIDTGKILELRGGVVLKRMTAHSVSTDPVVWLKGSSAVLRGAGQGVSYVLSENRAPKGVVRLGHKDMTESHANVTYGTVSELSISGPIAYGQTTGAPDVALYMPNPQFSGLVSYFHNIFGVRVVNANIGIYLHGWANANTFSNIQGYQLGNTTLGINKNAFIYCHGAIDNSFRNGFFHRSPGSIGLLVDDCDNSVNGGVTHSVYANSWGGLVCEQGGDGAYGVKSLITTGNSYYEVRANTALGNSIPAGFLDSNVFIALNSVNAGIGEFTTAKTHTANISVAANVTGSLSMGDSTGIYVAKKAKRVANGGNSATLSFTLSHTAQASIWRIGYIKIMAAGGDRSASTQTVAWYCYGASSLGTTYPTLGVLKDSGGDTAAFTISLTGSTLTISSTLDDMVAEVEYGFTNAGVSVT